MNRCLPPSLCAIFALTGCVGGGHYTEVSQAYNICLRDRGGSSVNLDLHKGIDFVYGVTIYNNVPLKLYIGNHPDIGNGKTIGTVRSKKHATLVYEGAFDSTQYVYVYGYVHTVKFGDQLVNMPVYVRLQVSNARSSRVAAERLGQRFFPCPQ